MAALALRHPPRGALLLVLLSSLVVLNIKRSLVWTIREGVKGEENATDNMDVEDTAETADTISFSLEEQVLFAVALAGPETPSPPPSRHFPLEHCSCSRSLPGASLRLDTEPSLEVTTCGRDAWARGSHQKVLAYSFYGSTNSSVHQKKQYFLGIQENLALVPSLYGPGWSMRLYHDLAPGLPEQEDLCGLACSSPHLDLCYVRELPGPANTNVSSMFPMNWRFLPTLDEQVDLFLCRDLDSRISSREVAAVAEWEEGGRPVHSMRDHPAHKVPLLGAAWGARLTQQNLRNKWTKSWTKMLADPLCWRGRGDKGPDQELLSRHVWPWARHMATQHDSYTCRSFPNSIGFPTERRDEKNNFVAAVVSEGEGRLWKVCPKKCRRRPEWEHC